MSNSVAEYGGVEIPGYNAFTQADRRTQPATIKANCFESQRMERPKLGEEPVFLPVSLRSQKLESEFESFRQLYPFVQ